MGRPMQMHNITRQSIVGIMAAGNDANVLQKQIEYLANLITAQGVAAVTCDPIISAESGFRAGAKMKKGDADLVILFLGAGSLPGNIIQGILACAAPVVLLDGTSCTESSAALDVESVMRRCLKPPVGLIDSMEDNREINAWCRVAAALRCVRGSVIGLLGSAPDALTARNCDPTTITRTFGIHIRMLEACALRALIVAADGSITGGLEGLITKYRLSGLAHHCTAAETHACAVLAARGFPIADEADVRSCVALHIANALDLNPITVELGRKYENVICFNPSVEIKPGDATIFSFGITSESAYWLTVAEGQILPYDTNQPLRFRPAEDAAQFSRRWRAGANGNRAIMLQTHRAELLIKWADAMSIMVSTRA